MTRAGERILAKMGETVLGHAWDATNDVIPSCYLTVDVASKKNKAKGVNDFITRENLDNLQSIIIITKRLVLSVISS